MSQCFTFWGLFFASLRWCVHYLLAQLQNKDILTYPCFHPTMQKWSLSKVFRVFCEATRSQVLFFFNQNFNFCQHHQLNPPHHHYWISLDGSRNLRDFSNWVNKKKKKQTVITGKECFVSWVNWSFLSDFKEQRLTKHSAQVKGKNISPLFFLSGAVMRSHPTLTNFTWCTAATHSFTHAHRRPLLIALLWKIINFPPIKPRFHAVGGPFIFFAAESTTAQSALWAHRIYSSASVYARAQRRIKL